MAMITKIPFLPAADTGTPTIPAKEWMVVHAPAEEGAQPGGAAIWQYLAPIHSSLRAPAIDLRDDAGALR